MFALRVLVLSLSPLLLAACVTSEEDRPSLQVVKDVDLHRYLGTWYEIASIPTYFQRGCIATKATYSLRKDGRIQVENECRRKTVDGDIQRAVGTAWVAGNGRETAKLRVQFFWPFRGDYWIIDLDKDYRYAVVGHPSRDYLWILSRTPTISQDLYAALLQKIKGQGYNTSLVFPTPQPLSAPSSMP